MDLKASLARCKHKLAVFAVLTTAIVQAAFAQSAPAAPGFTPQRRVGYAVGDQWEPAMAADAHGHIYILFPQYGPVTGCPSCTVPTMALLISNDNGVSWGQARPLLSASSGQFDAQVRVDPVDRQTLYASWMQGRHDIVVARSQDFGRSWYFAVAEHSPSVVIDKPVLAVRGPNVYVSFNHDQTLEIAASHDYAQNFSTAVVNPGAERGWSLAAGATVDPSGNVYFSWTAYPRTDLLTRPVQVFVSRSADGGRTWSTTPLDVSSAAPACLAQACSAGFLASQVALTSDDAGTIYALWNSGSVTGGPQRIYFSSSTNEGESWSAKVDVSKANDGIEHCFPAITAGTAGDVRIAWMDTRNAPLWNVFERSSINGGATWSSEVQLSGPARGYDYILSSGFLFPFGNLFSIAIDNAGNTQAVWGEGRNYKSPGSIWYSFGR
ncbi:MAG TPA: sialidase family protein [Candidatus Aquilonibacter sp.]|nr:sialidase family protein [Candidatus Aquilonibacter sp.]